MKNAFPVVLTCRLNLKPRDIAEIGDFSLRFAQALTAGKVPFPQDVVTSLQQIDGDIDTMLKDILASINKGQGHLYIFKTNDELRQHHPEWPARGYSSGPFIGPHRIATYHAWKALKEKGREPDVLFCP